MNRPQSSYMPGGAVGKSRELPLSTHPQTGSYFPPGTSTDFKQSLAPTLKGTMSGRIRENRELPLAPNDESGFTSRTTDPNMRQILTDGIARATPRDIADVASRLREFVSGDSWHRHANRKGGSR